MPIWKDIDNFGRKIAVRRTCRNPEIRTNVTRHLDITPEWSGRIHQHVIPSFDTPLVHWPPGKYLWIAADRPASRRNRVLWVVAELVDIGPDLTLQAQAAVTF